MEGALSLAAVILAGTFLFGAAGVVPGTISGRNETPFESTSYHGGKTETAPPSDGACQAPGCHDGYPHRKGTSVAVFRNMHLRRVDCLSCHGKEADRRWAVSGAPKDPSWRVRYPSDGRRSGPHAGMGPAMACRGCHSENGRAVLLERGVKELPSGFANPIALRMLEEGARRWDPTGGR